MEKDFEGWLKIKVESQERQNPPTFQEREIWWCRIGVNVCDEEDGKGNDFSRPVLIVRKFNKRIFWGVPLTTQIKDTPHYYKIHFKNKTQCVMLTQLRMWHNNRLMTKMGQLTKEQVKEIRKSLRELIN